MTLEIINTAYLDVDFDVDDDEFIGAEDENIYTAVACSMDIKPVTGVTAVAISPTSGSFRSHASTISSDSPSTTSGSGTYKCAPPSVLLPWEIDNQAYRPSEFVTFPIPIADLQTKEPVEARPQRRRSTMAKVLASVIRQKEVEKYRMVRIPRDDYVKYWARDHKGVYIGSEPEGSGIERLREGLSAARELSLMESRTEYRGF